MNVEAAPASKLAKFHDIVDAASLSDNESNLVAINRMRHMELAASDTSLGRHSNGSYWPPVLLFGSLFALHFAVAFPGIMNWDAHEQYTHAVLGQYMDWHPPIMSFVWSQPLAIADSAWPMLFLHIASYWFGLYNLYVALVRRSRRMYAYAVIAIGVLPNLFLMSAFILKDVGMAVSLIAAFSIVFKRRALGQRVSMIDVLLVAVFLSYATLVRSNSVFAVAPILLYFVAPRRMVGLLLPAFSLAIIAFAIPASTFINQQVIGATPTRPIMSLKLFNIAGVIHYSRSYDAIPRFDRSSLNVIDQCYSDDQWDEINRGQCEPLFRSPEPSNREWAWAVANHPIAFIKHRVAHMNEAMFFIVPHKHPSWYDLNYKPDLPRPPLEPMIKGSYERLRNMAIFSPAVYFSLAVVLAGFMLFNAKNVKKDEMLVASFYLLSSAAAYTAAWLLVGVASVYRYQQYPMTATLLGCVLFLASSSPRASWKRSTAIAAGSVGLATPGVVAWARMTLPA